MNLTIKATADPGAEISQTAHEACELATRIGTDVQFDFNGVNCIAQPNGNYMELVGEWYLAMSGHKEYKLAFARTKELPDLKKSKNIFEVADLLTKKGL